MNKILYALILIVFPLKAAWADRCGYITRENAEKAVEILKQEKEILNYCNSCPDERPAFEKVNKVEYRYTEYSSDGIDYFQVYMNDKRKDIAYIYIKRPEGYESLGFITNCPEAFDDTFVKPERFYKGGN